MTMFGGKPYPFSVGSVVIRCTSIKHLAKKGANHPPPTHIPPCSLERVMEEFALGPNGGLVYCMEYLLEHVDWLVEQVRACV